MNNLLNKLEQTPLGIIDQLEAELQGRISKVLSAIGPFNSYVNCICSAADELSNPANLATAKNFYSELMKKPTLISDELTGKMGGFREASNQLKQVVSTTPRIVF